MASLFVADGEVSFAVLRSFDSQGVCARESDEDGNVFLTDGTNCLWVYAPTDDWPVAFEACGKNDPAKIISVIEEVLGVHLISEYEEVFEKLRRKQ
jgi:hypothetical protein